MDETGVLTGNKLGKGGLRVTVSAPYIHALDGRLRIKLVEVKGSPTRALEIESRLREYPGIHQVSANPVTGNVLILYDPIRLAQHEVLDTLRSLGLLKEHGHAERVNDDGSGTPQLGKLLANTLARTTMELAVQGLIRALI
jgi:hypothetical protein